MNFKIHVEVEVEGRSKIFLLASYWYIYIHTYFLVSLLFYSGSLLSSLLPFPAFSNGAAEGGKFNTSNGSTLFIFVGLDLLLPVGEDWPLLAVGLPISRMPLRKK